VIKDYRCAVEQEEDWSGWCNKIPALKFKSSWDVKVIPPFCGAIARFTVSKNGSDFVSVYLDCFDALGFMYKNPYWEIYPDHEGENKRFMLNETKQLISAIDKSLKRLARKK
jgi:hypothetical protein